jgi:hypothetical protein
MQFENLSKHSAHYRIASFTADGKEYWAGGNDWVADPEKYDVSIMGHKRALEWVARLNKRGIDVHLVPADIGLQLINWKGIGWVFISALTGRPHQVKFVNSRGTGWFIKDVGTIEQTLCINYSKDYRMDIVIRGDQIGEVTAWVEGTVMNNFGSFTIPSDSNLIYQFEIEVEPIPELS